MKTEKLYTKLKTLLEDQNVQKYIYLSNKLKKQNKSSNEIWIYVGSYYIYMDEYGFEYDYQVKDELEDNFAYNKYKSLSTNKEVDIKDYQNFEREHIVLKEYNKTYNEYITEYFIPTKTKSLTHTKNKNRNN